MTNLNIYLLIPDNAGGYDTYDSAVVYAKNEVEAKLITPADENKFKESWARSPDHVEATLVGKALKGAKAGLLLASFRAG